MEVQEDARQRIDAFEDAFLGAKHQLRQQTSVGLPGVLQPGDFAGAANQWDKLLFQRLGGVNVQTQTADDALSGQGHGAVAPTMGEAADDRLGPDGGSILFHEQGKVPDPQLGQRPSGAKAPLGELPPPERNDSANALRLLRIQQSGVRLLGGATGVDFPGEERLDHVNGFLRRCFS